MPAPVVNANAAGTIKVGVVTALSDAAAEVFADEAIRQRLSV
jgi:hypothetical protein